MESLKDEENANNEVLKELNKEEESNTKDKEVYAKIKPFCKKMIIDILTEKPDNVPLFMLNWLRKYAGIECKKLNDEELLELAKLKELMTSYKQMEEAQSKK